MKPRTQYYTPGLHSQFAEWVAQAAEAVGNYLKRVANSARKGMAGDTLYIIHRLSRKYYAAL